jgi:hypothetical protein
MTFDLDIRGFFVNVLCLVTDGFVSSSSTSIIDTSPSLAFFEANTGIPVTPVTVSGLLNIFPGVEVAAALVEGLGDHKGSPEGDFALTLEDEEAVGDKTPFPWTAGLFVIVPSNDDDFFCPILVAFGAALAAVVVSVEPADPDAAGSSIFFALANELAVGANNLEPELELTLKRPFVPRLSAPAFEVVRSLVPMDETPPLFVLAREILLPPIEFSFMLDILLPPSVPDLPNGAGISDLVLEPEPAIEAFRSCPCATESPPLEVPLTTEPDVVVADLVGAKPAVDFFLTKLGLRVTLLGRVASVLAEAAEVGVGFAAGLLPHILVTNFFAEAKNPNFGLDF